MHTKKTRLILTYIIIFATVGLIDAFSIHLKEIAALTDNTAFDSCNINSLFSCGAVARSSASHFLGIPVSLVGILFYEGALIGALTLWMGLKLNKILVGIISTIALVAIFFSFRLLYISWFGIGALCPYCLVSNITTLFIVICWFWYVFSRPKISE